MNEPNEKKRPQRNFVWPGVETIDDAKWATKQAMGAAIICAGVTAVFSILSICGVDFVRKTLHVSGLSLIDAGIFGLIAIFLARQSRFAAWCGLGIYLIERVYAWYAVPASRTNLLLPIVFTLAFITGVRGAYAFHRLRETTPPEAERMVA